MRKGRLHCEQVDVARIAAKVGTPAYVYSARSFRESYMRLDRAFTGLPHHICYSVKANSNLSILRMLARQGSYFDIVSGGELARILAAKIPANRVVFSGVGKSREEMRDALRAGILLFNVESEAEVAELAAEAQRLRRRAPAGIRVNPDVAAGGHPHISTGAHTHKFGVDLADARHIYRDWRDSKWIDWQGISAHIGSQILSVAPFRTAIARLAWFVRELANEGIRLKYFDFGGGIGIRYTDESPLPLADYAAALKQAVGPLGCTLLLEPGRVIAGPAGVILTRVVRTKVNRGKSFIIADAAMNDLMRPALYHATHPITVAARSNPRAETRNAKLETRSNRNRRLETVTSSEFRVSNFEFRISDVVGPICETGDRFLQNWPLGPVATGDLLAIWATGAYGMSLASNTNSRLRAPEVLVDGRRFKIIRRRETNRELFAAEL